MLKRRLIALFAALVMGFALAPAQAQGAERAHIETMAAYYAQYYGVPLELVRRVINRESTFNPRARNGPYYGLMQIHPQTAQTMGYRGTPQGLLDAETNLIFAVKYLRGAYMVANGNQDRAVQLYAAGYYYHARDAGLLEVTGLRPGPNSPPTPAPRFGAPGSAPAAQPAPQFEPAVVASIAPQAAPVAAPAPAPAVAPLGFLPPSRPLDLETEAVESASLAAIQIAAPTPPRRPEPPEPQPAPEAEPDEAALAEEEATPAPEATMEPPATRTAALRPSLDLIADSFAALDALAAQAP